MLCFCCSIDAKHPPLQHEVETPKYYCDNCDSTKDQFFIHQYGICQCCHDVKHGKYKFDLIGINCSLCKEELQRYKYSKIYGKNSGYLPYYYKCDDCLNLGSSDDSSEE